MESSDMGSGFEQGATANTKGEKHRKPLEIKTVKVGVGQGKNGPS